MFSKILKNIIDGSECKNRTSITIDKDDRYLQVEFRCDYTERLDTPYSRYNDPIYRGEVVEFFVGEKNAELYYEFDLAPNNVLFNAMVLSHERYGAFVKVIDERFVKHTVENYGNTYLAIIKIPFAKIGGKNQNFVFNAYRIVSNGNDKEFQSLNPIGEINFHRRDKFVELKMED